MFENAKEPDTIVVHGRTYKVDTRAGVLRCLHFKDDTIRFQDLEEILLAGFPGADRETREQCLASAARLDSILGRVPGSGCGRLLADMNSNMPAALPAARRIVRRRDRSR